MALQLRHNFILENKKNPIPLDFTTNQKCMPQKINIY